MSDKTLQQSQIEEQHGAVLAQILAGLQEAVDRSLTRLDAHDVEMAKMLAAFPGGNTEGHARYHEVVIQQLEEKRKLRIAIQEKTISGLIWAALVAAGTAIWHQVTGR